MVELGFAPRPGEAVRRSLVVELMGRHSNLFLLDEDRRVVAAGRQVRDQQSRLRPIGTGDVYTAPPPERPSPRGGQSEASWRAELSLLPLPLGRALGSAFQGISPALALQLAGPERSGAEALLATPVQELSDAQWHELWRRWRCWLEALEQECFALHTNGPTAYSCWGATGEARTEGADDSSSDRLSLPINGALAAHHHAVLRSRELQRRRASLELRLRQALEREQSQQREQRQRLAQVESSDQLQRQADALLCLAQPSREQVAEAQSLYRRARRLRRSVEAINPRLALHEARIAQLEASLTYLAQGAEGTIAAAEQLLELQALEEDSEALLRQGRQEQRRRGAGGRTESAGPTPLELRTPGGLRLQVGRNHRQNDWISLRQARRGDLWFHAQECPGSHVVLKSSEGNAGEPDLQAAADVAAHFSRARDNSRVAVVMVASENLQRIPGAGLARCATGAARCCGPNRPAPGNCWRLQCIASGGIHSHERTRHPAGGGARPATAATDPGGARCSAGGRRRRNRRCRGGLPG